jgi:chemotaxis protein methyltransferase WspC
MDFTAIGQWLSSHTGMSPEILGDHALRRAITKRLSATASQDSESYCSILLTSEAEQDALVDLLVVPETWFFRDRQPFVYLERHVGKRLAAGDTSQPQPQLQSPTQPLRLLSAPCASGEEPYSMAMTLLDLGLSTSEFSIDAIDICKASIRKARKAVYGKHSFRGVSPEEQRRHFVATTEGFCLDPKVAQCVKFQRSNLMRCLETIAAPYDVVFCRNLLIYLEDQASQYLLESIGRLLKPGGLLGVGSAETGKVPVSMFSPLRESFVFGFERRSQVGFDDVVEAPGPLVARPTASQRTTPALRKAPLRTAPKQRRVAPRRSPLPADGPSTELDRCRRSLESDPSCDPLYLRMADLLIQDQQKQEALVWLRKYLYLQPQSTEVLHKLIEISRELGQHQESEQFKARLARLTS